MAAMNQTNMSFSWEHDFHSTMVIIACLTILMNIPVIFLFIKMTSLRYSAGNAFLCGLAVADILCAVLMIPLGLLCDIQQHGITKQRLCRAYYITNYTISVASVYHIVAANIAKYFAIVFPMRNITAFTKARVKYTILIIWVVGFLAGHLPIYWPYIRQAAIHNMIKIHSLFLLVFAFILPILVLIITHIHIYGNLHLRVKPQHEGTTTRQGTLRENNRRIALLFLLLFSVFILSWLPWYLIGVKLIDSTNDYWLTLRYVAPILNPLVFTFVKRDFRKAAGSVLANLCGFKTRHRFPSNSRFQSSRTECSLDSYRAAPSEHCNPPGTEAETSQVSTTTKL